MVTQTLFFNFKMNPYFFEDINTAYGPNLKELMNTNNDETYYTKFLKVCDFDDSYTESSSTWANSLFNPQNGVLDSNHCIKDSGYDESKFSEINGYTTNNLKLLYTRISGSRGGMVSLQDSSIIETNFGDSVSNLAGMMICKANTGNVNDYVLAYAIATQEMEVSGHFQVPFVSGTSYGRVLTRWGKTLE